MSTILSVLAWWQRIPFDLALLAGPIAFAAIAIVHSYLSRWLERVMAYLDNSPDSGPRPLDADLRALLAERDALVADKERLDFLQAEEDRTGRVMSLVVKVNHDRDSSEWANIFGDVRAAIDAARITTPARVERARGTE